jgi:hypothetical protein
MLILICSLAAPPSSSQLPNQDDQDVKATPLAKQSNPATPQDEMKFKLLRISHGVNESGGFSRMSYESTSHVKLDVTILHLDSREGARKEYDDRVKEAVRIIEQGTVQDRPASKPPTTEDRAVMVVPVTGKDCNEFFVVVATAGTALRVLQSCSLDAVIQFEKNAKHAESVDDRFVVR